MGSDDHRHPGARLVSRPARDGFEAIRPPVRIRFTCFTWFTLKGRGVSRYCCGLLKRIKVICKMVNKICIFQCVYIYIYIINILHVSRYSKKLGSSWLHFCFCWILEIASKSALCRWLGMCAAGKSAFLLGKGAGAESHAPNHTLEKLAGGFKMFSYAENASCMPESTQAGKWM